MQPAGRHRNTYPRVINSLNPPAGIFKYHTPRVWPVAGRFEYIDPRVGKYGQLGFKVACPHFLHVAHSMVVVVKNYLDNIVKKLLLDNIIDTIKRSFLFRQ